MTEYTFPDAFLEIGKDDDHSYMSLKATRQPDGRLKIDVEIWHIIELATPLRAEMGQAEIGQVLRLGFPPVRCGTVARRTWRKTLHSLVIDILEEAKAARIEFQGGPCTFTFDKPQPDAAERSYRGAIASHDHTLDLAPDYLNAHSNKGDVLQSLGDLQAGLDQTEEARQSYRQAIACYDRALALAPDHLNAHSNKGDVLQSLGDLQAGLAQTEEARQSYQQAIACYDRALALAPELTAAVTGKSSTVEKLAKYGESKIR